MANMAAAAASVPLAAIALKDVECEVEYKSMAGVKVSFEVS